MNPSYMVLGYTLVAVVLSVVFTAMLTEQGRYITTEDAFVGVLLGVFWPLSLLVLGVTWLAEKIR